MKIATAIILAAGFSRRFGGDKLLAELQGRPLLMHVVQTVLKIGFSQVILVYRDPAVAALIPAGIELYFNEKADEGIGSSVRCGAMHAKADEPMMFFMGDQPFVTDRIIGDLFAIWEQGGKSIVVPSYGKTRGGSPTLFAAKWREALSALTGDKGGRAIIERFPAEVTYVDIEEQQASLDLDTREDFLVASRLKIKE